jgi:hypothetical protein
MPKQLAPRLILFVCGEEQTYRTIFKSIANLKSERRNYPELAYFLKANEQMRLTTVEAATAELFNAADPIEPALIVLDALVRFSDVPLANDGDAAIYFMKWLDRYRPSIPVLVIAVGSTESLERRVLARNNASLWRLEPSGRRNVLAEALAGIAPRPRKSADTSEPSRRITINVGRESASYRVSNGRYEFLTSGPISYEKRTALDKLMEKVDTLSPWPPSGTLPPNGTWYRDALENGQKLFEILIKDTVGTHLIELLKHPALPNEKSPKIDLRFEIDLGLSDYVKLFKLPFEMVNHEDFDGVLCSRIPMARRIRLGSDLDTTPPGLVSLSQGDPLRTLFIDASVSGDVRLRKYKSPAMSKTYSFGPLHTANQEREILQACAEELGPLRMAPVQLCSQGDSARVGDDLYDDLRHKISSGFDLVHFCGHSATLEDGATYLILPGSEDTPLAVPIAEFASWLCAGQCRMVVLSSCEGASALTALETMRHGVRGMLGFRYMVEEDLCVEYFARFYDAYLRHEQSFCESYRFACSQLQQGHDGSPAWASALAVLRD